MYKTIAEILDTIAVLVFTFYIPLKVISSHSKLSKHGKGFMIAAITWVLLSRLGIGWQDSILAIAINSLIRPVDIFLALLINIISHFFSGLERTLNLFMFSGTFLLLSDIGFIYVNKYLLEKISGHRVLILNGTIMLLTVITLAVIYLDDFLFGMSGF